MFAALVRYCTTNCIGSTFPTGFSSSYPVRVRPKTFGTTLLLLIRLIPHTTIFCRLPLSSSICHNFLVITAGLKPICFTNLTIYYWFPLGLRLWTSIQNGFSALVAFCRPQYELQAYSRSPVLLLFDSIHTQIQRTSVLLDPIKHCFV